jgi:hypothetical protein
MRAPQLTEPGRHLIAMCVVRDMQNSRFTHAVRTKNLGSFEKPRGGAEAPSLTRCEWLTVIAISGHDAETWCRQHEILLSEGGFPDLSALPIKFSIHSDAGARVSLVSRSMEAFRGEPELLVWFKDWSVWPSGERMHIFERVRKSYGEVRQLGDAPATLFEAGEIEDAISFVTVAVLFLWDCYVLTPSGAKLLFFSHDECGYTNFDLRL